MIMSAGAGWYVVKFMDENAIEVVPSNWLLNFEQCVWPKYPSFAKGELQAALKNRIAPEEDWSKHRIKMISKKLYTKFQSANSSASKAVEQSDIEQTEDLPPKRIRHRNKKYSESSTDSEKSEGQEEGGQYEIPDLPQIPDSIFKSPSESTTVTIIGSHCSQTPLTRSLLIEPVSRNGSNTNSTILKPATSKHSDLNVENEDDELHRSYSSTPMSSRTNSRVENGDSLNQGEFQKQVIRYLVALNTRQREQNDLIQLVLNRVENLNDASTHTHSLHDETELDMISQFPIVNEEALKEVESFIENKDNFQKVVCYMSSIGGRTMSECVRRVLSKIFTNEFAQEFSWIGHKGKKPFCNLRLADILKTTLRRNNNSWSERDIELSASKWLAKAKERLKANTNKKDD